MRILLEKDVNLEVINNAIFNLFCHLLVVVAILEWVGQDHDGSQQVIKLCIKGVSLALVACDFDSLGDWLLAEEDSFFLV